MDGTDKTDGANDWDEQQLVETTWLITERGDKLHHARLTHPLDEGALETTACGRQARVSVPGIFSRMQRERCQRCCEVTGIPPGVGSPKNDPTCRQILGLDGPTIP